MRKKNIRITKNSKSRSSIRNKRKSKNLSREGSKVKEVRRNKGKENGEIR